MGFLTFNIKNKMKTKWFSTKRYEFEALAFGVILFVGSWFLSTQFGAPELIRLPLFIIGGVFIVLSAFLIALRLIAPYC